MFLFLLSILNIVSRKMEKHGMPKYLSPRFNKCLHFVKMESDIFLIKFIGVIMVSKIT